MHWSSRVQVGPLLAWRRGGALPRSLGASHFRHLRFHPPLRNKLYDFRPLRSNLSLSPAPVSSKSSVRGVVSPSTRKMRSSLIAAALSLFTAVGSAAQIAFPNAFQLSEHKDPDHLLPLPTLHELLILHRELIKQPSITYSEYEQGWWLVSYLKEAGWSVETQQVGCRMMGKERFNILAWPGKEKPTRGTLLTTHYDTVSRP